MNINMNIFVHMYVRVHQLQGRNVVFLIQRKSLIDFLCHIHSNDIGVDAMATFSLIQTH